MFVAMRASRIFGTPYRAAWTSATAEIIAEDTSPIPGRRPIIGSRPKRIFVPGKRRNSSMMSASHRKSSSREARSCRTSGGRTSHSHVSDPDPFGFAPFGSGPVLRLPIRDFIATAWIARRSQHCCGGLNVLSVTKKFSRTVDEPRSRLLTRNSLQHLGVRREFFHEHQQTLDRFLWFVAGKASADEVDFLQFPRLQQQFLTPRAGEENIDRWINPLVADFSIEHHFHVSGAFEFLKDQLVHAAPRFN